MTSDPRGTDLTPLLGLSPTAPELADCLCALVGSSPSSSRRAPSATLASYPDIVYLSYHALGVSLSFEPTISSYRPAYKLSSVDQLEPDKLYCVGIDVYNHEHTDGGDGTKSSGSTSSNEYEPFPQYPILLPAPALASSSSSPPGAAAAARPFPLTPTTTGKDLVAAYGEPTRKGGGDTKGMGIWTEWTREGIMVEWKSSGLGAWDKGGETQWRVLSLFEPGVGKGKDDDDDE
ncbi:hypothetical protein JCM11491_005555 [Sporobolomyces phaffii]